MLGEPIDSSSPEAEGCGLSLCEDCAGCQGELKDLNCVMEAIEAEAEKSGEIWFMGLRADAESLKAEGLLLKNVLSSGGEGEGEEEDAMDVDG
jgi:hypothetical protein